MSGGLAPGEQILISDKIGIKIKVWLFFIVIISLCYNSIINTELKWTNVKHYPTVCAYGHVSVWTYVCIYTHGEYIYTQTFICWCVKGIS